MTSWFDTKIGASQSAIISARSRANAVRALTLPTQSRVLEIGAGCGAITRYLGETFEQVDALEPMLARARVARSQRAILTT